MHSPPVQPIAWSRSGAGAVITMSLVIATRRPASSRSPAAHALVATTRRSAVRRPRSHRTTTGWPREKERTRVCSKIRTPDSSATRRSPRASRAGCTVAAEASKTPARWTADPERRAISSGESGGTPPTPRRSQAATTPSQAPSCAAGRRGPQPAAAAEVRVDPVRAAEVPNLVDRRLRVARNGERVRVAAQTDQRGDLGPPREDEAAVAPGGAAAADVLLEHDDVASGVQLADADRRPEPDVAAAEDRDVGAAVALPGSARPARRRLQCRPEPPEARRSGAWRRLSMDVHQRTSL